jgi:hypothetical protein
MSHSKLVPTIIGFTILLVGCSKMSEPNATENKIADIVGNTGTQHFSGKFFFPETRSNALLLFTKSKDAKNGDGYFDKAFVLVSEKPLALIPAFSGSEMEITILKNKKILLLTNSMDGIVHLLATYDMESEVNRVKIQLQKAGLQVGTVNYGYGISFLNGIWEKEKAMNSRFKQPFTILDDADVKLAKKIQDGRIQLNDADDDGNLCALGSCTSGGAGSTSCSITEPGNGCEVSCTGGYYACCNSSTVRCYCCKIQ